MVGGGKGGMRWIEDVWKETSEGRLGGEFGERMSEVLLDLMAFLLRHQSRFRGFFFGASVFACPHVSVKSRAFSLRTITYPEVPMIAKRSRYLKSIHQSQAPKYNADVQGGRCHFCLRLPAHNPRKKVLFCPPRLSVADSL